MTGLKYGIITILTAHYMDKLTTAQLKEIAPVSDKAAELFMPYIYKYMGDVNTPIRFAAFLANVLHESGCFRYVREIASGDAYEGRKDLGNVFKGDGRLFKGRGLIQLTGRSNYLEISKDWFGDDTLVRNPELLATCTCGNEQDIRLSDRCGECGKIIRL